MDPKWKYKVEQDIQLLAQSISKLSISLEKFIEYSKEIQHEKFSKIHDVLNDHEARIRKNTKFVYQALAGIGAIMILIDLLFKSKILR
ncbi:MAG: hypothetical protein ACRCVW_00085 [Brevinema sp.]